MSAAARTFWWTLTLAAVVGASGCSTYSHRVNGIRDSFYRNDLAGAEQQVRAGIERDSGDADVLRLEEAMICLANNRPAEAEKLLRAVRDNFDHLEQADLAESAMSYLTDDQRRAYAGEDYERVLVRALLALSNLLHDGSDAEAYSLQTIDKQEQIIAAGKDDKGQNPKQNYQRVALAPYLRGVLREASHHDYDDARRSFETVAAWQPEFAFAKHDVERAVYGRHSERGHGVLYVFALTGRGPHKEEAIEVPSSAALLIAGEILSATGKQSVPPNIAPVKVPRVVARRHDIQEIGVRVDGHDLGRTATITNVTNLAINQYDAIREQIVARAVARRIVKKGIVYGAKEASEMVKGTPASFAVDLAGVAWEATESADTRCWGLLPDQIQVLRVELPAGRHEIELAPVIRGATVRNAPSRRFTIADGDNTYLLAVFPSDRMVGQIAASRP